jgi:geranylgeranyl diphosphate synthase type I
MVDLLSNLRLTAEEFNPILEEFIRSEISDPSLQEKTLYAVSIIGERERPFLVRVATELSGGVFADTMPLALAAELFIASALTGDDLVDKASTRGGNESVWRKWGDAFGLLVAETLHTLSNRALSLLWQNELMDKIVVRQVVDDFQSAFRDVFIGQHMQSALEGIPEVSEKQCIDLAFWKTGRLLQLCLTAPAVLNGASDHVLCSLSEYGRLVGIAFQLRDDIIDFIGEEELIGKPTLGDLRNGQPNFVLTHFFAHASQEDRQRLLRWWNKHDTQPNISEILDACIRTGSIQYAFGVLKTYCAAAQDVLNPLPASRAKALLSKFAELIADLPICE